jgi:predicted peptidase
MTIRSGRCFSVVLLSTWAVSAHAQARPLLPAVRQTAHIFTSSLFHDPVGYYLYLPEGYDRDSTTLFPLLVFLHGAGERGTGTSELPRVLKFGLPRLIEAGRDFPFIVVTPQLPAGGEAWPVVLVDEVLAEAARRFRVDSSRIYLTGLSDGGDAAWAYAMARPRVPAAIVPIAAGGRPEGICAMRGVAVWAFHGELDRAVRLTEAQRLVKALNSCVPAPAEPARLTVYAGAGHLVWTRTYEGTVGVDIYSWLLQHHHH